MVLKTIGALLFCFSKETSIKVDLKKEKGKKKKWLPGPYPNKYIGKRIHLLAYMKIMKRCAVMTHFRDKFEENCFIQFHKGTLGKESLFSN